MATLKQMFELAAGVMLEFSLPQLGRELDSGFNGERSIKLKRAILQARMWRAKKTRDVDALQRTLNSYWRSASGDKFHIEQGQASFEHFRVNHSESIDILRKFIHTSDLCFTRIVEIGCGNGAALAYCTEKLPWSKRAVGIDINACAIERAVAAQPPGSRLEFVCADAVDWLAGHPQSGTVLLSNGGVLEYFSQEGVDRLLQALALSRPAALLLLEPLDTSHDLSHQTNSYSFHSVGGAGSEITFSHNHQARLQQAGFEIMFAQSIQFCGTRGIMILSLYRG